MSNILVPDTPSDKGSTRTRNSDDAAAPAAPWLHSNLSNGWASPTYAQVVSRSPSPTSILDKVGTANAPISDEEEKGDLTPFSDKPGTPTPKTVGDGEAHLHTPHSSPPGTPTAPTRASRVSKNSTRSETRNLAPSESPSDQAAARRNAKTKTPAHPDKLPALATSLRFTKRNKQDAKKAIREARKRKRMESDVGEGTETDGDTSTERMIGRGNTDEPGGRLRSPKDAHLSVGAAPASAAAPNRAYARTKRAATAPITAARTLHPLPTPTPGPRTPQPKGPTIRIPPRTARSGNTSYTPTAPHANEGRNPPDVEEGPYGQREGTHERPPATFLVDEEDIEMEDLAGEAREDEELHGRAALHEPSDDYPLPEEENHEGWYPNAGAQHHELRFIPDLSEPDELDAQPEPPQHTPPAPAPGALAIADLTNTHAAAPGALAPLSWPKINGRKFNWVFDNQKTAQAASWGRYTGEGVLLVALGRNACADDNLTYIDNMKDAINTFLDINSTYVVSPDIDDPNGPTPHTYMARGFTPVHTNRLLNKQVISNVRTSFAILSTRPDATRLVGMWHQLEKLLDRSPGAILNTFRDALRRPAVLAEMRKLVRDDKDDPTRTRWILHTEDSALQSLVARATTETTKVLGPGGVEMNAVVLYLDSPTSNKGQWEAFCFFLRRELKPGNDDTGIILKRAEGDTTL